MTEGYRQEQLDDYFASQDTTTEICEKCGEVTSFNVEDENPICNHCFESLCEE